MRPSGRSLRVPMIDYTEKPDGSHADGIDYEADVEA